MPPGNAVTQLIESQSAAAAHGAPICLACEPESMHVPSATLHCWPKPQSALLAQLGRQYVCTQP